MIFKWYYIPLSVFTFPTLLVFLITAWLFYRVKSWHISGGCVEVVCGRIFGNPMGQCWGCLGIAYDSQETRRDAVIRVHERVHAVQGIVLNGTVSILGLLTGYWLSWWWVVPGLVAFPVVYLTHFAWRYLVSGFDFWYAYRGLWFERQAYDTYDQVVSGRRDLWGISEKCLTTSRK